MKVQFFSDLHLDVAPVKPIVVRRDVDLVVVAGDVCEGARNAFAALRRIVPDRVPVAAVLGNHEFYRRCVPDEIAEARTAAAHFDVAFLENDVAIFGGGAIRVLGCTLWTDYRIFGEASVKAAMANARSGMNDHRVISWRKKPWQRFRPEEALSMHERSRAFLGEALADPFAGETIVLTHHAVHFGSVEPRYREDLLTAAFVSDLSDLMTTAHDRRSPDGRRAKIAIWNHGHVHSSHDYVVNGTTRVLANSHGYGSENRRFDPELVLEIGR